MEKGIAADSPLHDHLLSGNQFFQNDKSEPDEKNLRSLPDRAGHILSVFKSSGKEAAEPCENDPLCDYICTV